MIDKILVETSPGELIDKLTILRLKSEKITDPAKLVNIHKEQEVLSATADRVLPDSVKLKHLWNDLYEINTKLWDIENDIRAQEAQKDFGDRFVELARAVYVTNDRRADVKKKINLFLGSELIEEKSYAHHGMTE